VADLALCKTCRVWHTVELKPKAKEELQEQLKYGTHSLPREFWTPKAKT